ncbi:saccharopine dehydrogenase family protein [Subtercola endophyticus]|uniref:saccharopine dehydrogenase NADP-binding domain-containing protein n=1 Tax=Subtercola endophyticus TaxID=2895559 RepID=UPI001E41921D|nr:saccharopine dehydrogenase NADP-binding domain-containing protein [Subtercola endophyticus]UFS59685.1 saccharopine dehydrogenase NADP-binding domain-containing protein [Subtercola endophyticus]
MSTDIWILGATGRTGGDVARRLHAAGASLVLAGRSKARLETLNAQLGGGHRMLVGTLDDNLAALAAEPASPQPLNAHGGAAPRVVVNTVGPFADTSLRVARACPPGTHYLDIANEFSAVDDILRLDRQAQLNSQVLVTGAGFGVLGTESAALRARADRPRPTRVRVDALASLALNDGRVGAALAGSIVEVLEFGGREVREGRLVRSRTGEHPLRLVTPDGDELNTGGGASGELLSAWRATDADTVIAASTAAPTGAVLRRLVLPVLSAVIRMPGMHSFVSARIARVKLHAGPMARRSSWGHAVAEWNSGESREVWLRVGDGGVFTADVMTEVALRLARGEGRPGAHTPGALFGTELAESLGGEYLVTESAPSTASAR